MLGGWQEIWRRTITNKYIQFLWGSMTFVVKVYADYELVYPLISCTPLSPYKREQKLMHEWILAVDMQQSGAGIALYRAQQLALKATSHVPDCS